MLQQEPELTFTAPSLFEQNFLREYTKLNECQREAVDALQGPVLVVAGPGTGKTQIISVRICNLLRSRDDQVNPQNILCLTYTDNGAISMRKRLLSIIGATAHQVKICTFHAFCNDVIQSNLDYFGKRELELISDLERVTLIETILNGLPVDHPLKKLKGDLRYDVKRLTNLFNSIKSENWMPEYIHAQVRKHLDELPVKKGFYYEKKYKDKIKGDIKENAVKAETEKMQTLLAAVDLFPIYDGEMKKMGRYDYQDMILWVIKAFRENPEMLLPYQEQFRYILVDEFQDTNGAQYDILQLLTEDPIDNYPNIFCVGDDDQSIYEFQGARIHNIMEFAAKYEGSLKTIVLIDNYRSTQAVLDTAKNVIDNNNDRLVKKLPELTKDIQSARPERQSSTAVPHLFEFENIAREETFVAEEIARLVKEEGVQPNHIAVLYYKHAQAENLANVFQKTGIPVQVRKRINILHEVLTRQIIDILMYLDTEFRKANSGEEYIFRIMHYRFFDIDIQDIAHISSYCNSKKVAWRECIGNNTHLDHIRIKNLPGIQKFNKNINEWLSGVANLTLQMLTEKIINESTLLAYILKHPDKLNLLEELNTFFDFIKAESLKKPRMGIRQFVAMLEQMETHEISLNINKAIFKEEGVVFSTCHNAKGSEYRYVFVIGCTKNVWDEERGNQFNFSMPDTITYSNTENQVESARRLFYVALTRAEEYLYVTYSASNNEGKPLFESRFVTETGLTKEEGIVRDEALLNYTVSLLQVAPPQIALPEKDFINERLQNFMMSASTFNKYIGCPLTFYFENVIKIPRAKNESMAFGSAVHFALDQLFKHLKGNEDTFPPKEDFVRSFEWLMRKEKDSFTEKQYENRLIMGRKLLPEYYDYYLPRWNKIVKTEYRIPRVQINGVPCTGVLDKVEFTGDDMNVVDYKTGSPDYSKERLLEPGVKHADGGEYWRQMYFYKLLTDANHYNNNWKMVSGEFNFIEKDKEDKFKIEKVIIRDDHLQFMRDRIKAVYDNIMNHEFNKGCGEKDCDWCNFVRDNKLEM